MKKLLAMIITSALCLSLASCSNDNSKTVNGTDIGELEVDSISILGVTYDLYSNGYALIESILHENAQIDDTVLYDDKTYTVSGFVSPDIKALQSTGAFGMGQTKSPENLVLPNSIQHIPSYALAYCDAQTITLPSNMETIGLGAFRECFNITYLSFPNSTTTIFAKDLFQNCINLKSVTFPENCDILFFEGVFLGCESLETVVVPASVEYIGWLSFKNCSSLTDVTIQNGVKEINEGAFIDCPAISKIVIPDSVTTIADYAFQGCTGLVDITLSDSMIDVSANLFADVYKQPIDVPGMTIRVKEELVSYVQSIYPEATVVAK